MKLMAVAALVALVATPVALSGSASAQSLAKQTAKNRPVVAAPQPMEQRAIGASPSGHPDWDVYVNGRYEGSDPDPRVRWTIRTEATKNGGMR